MLAENMLEYLSAVSAEYSWLAIAFHLGFLLLFILWFTYKKKVYSLISFYFFCTALSVSTIAAIKGNVFVTTWFAFIALFWGIEIFQKENVYSWKKPKPVLVNCGVAAFFALLYPQFISDYMLGVINSPLGLIPSPALMLMLAFLCLSTPKVNRPLYIFTMLAGLFFGIFGVFVLKVHVDLILLFISLYAVYLLIEKRLFKALS